MTKKPIEEEEQEQENSDNSSNSDSFLKVGISPINFSYSFGIRKRHLGSYSIIICAICIVFQLVLRSIIPNYKTMKNRRKLISS